MTTMPGLGPILYSFFVDHLATARGLRPASIQSYRDVLRLFLLFVSSNTHRKITRLTLADLTFDRVLAFLAHLETVRLNQVRTRNQRLALLHTFFDYLGARVPEMVAVSQRVAAIPRKRVAPPETQFLEREEIATLFSSLPLQGRHAQRDRALILFMYNTGARVQEVADLCVGNLDLDGRPRVRLHGKGDKWRVCPLWADTAQQLGALLAARRLPPAPNAPVFTSSNGRPLTRFGLYKIIRRLTARIDEKEGRPHHVSPHVFRHTTAVHLLESGVEVNVIRGWLGHVSLETTNRYAEIDIRAKEEALRLCEPPSESSAEFPRKPVWRGDETLLTWLDSL